MLSDEVKSLIKKQCGFIRLSNTGERAKRLMLVAENVILNGNKTESIQIMGEAGESEEDLYRCLWKTIEQVSLAANVKN